jgi:hypothetical protein
LQFHSRSFDFAAFEAASDYFHPHDVALFIGFHRSLPSLRRSCYWQVLR